MNAVGRFFDRHPWVAAILVVALFGVVGTMDVADQEREAAYEAGFRDGRNVAATATPSEDIDQQIAALCRLEWPATPEAIAAKKRGCKHT